MRRAGYQYLGRKGQTLDSVHVRKMMLIRRVEETLLALFDRGMISGTVHTCLGQEACAVGVVAALDASRDYVFSNHRGHGHYLAFTGDSRGLIAEILGYESGICRGFGGSQHLHAGRFYASGVQGGLAGVANGVALATRREETQGLVAVFLGDGTLGQGIVYEAMNIASLWRLPVLYIVESNGYAQSTRTSAQHAGDLTSRASTFGIPVDVVDGNDLNAVLAAAAVAVQVIRQEGHPRLLHLETYRLGPHSKGDDSRDADELERHWREDPLRRLGATNDGVALHELSQSVNQEVEAVLRDLGVI